MSKFKVGDTVRVTKPSSPLFDQAFKVCGTWRGSREWAYNFTVRGETHTLSEHHLTLADPDVHEVLAEMAEQSGLDAESAPKLPAFMVGERVMVVDTVGDCGGRTGVVTGSEDFEGGDWLVKLDGNDDPIPFMTSELCRTPRKDMAEQEIDGEYDRTRGMPAAPFDNPLPNRRAVILRAAEDLVNGQRADDYGDPEENFQRIASLWSVIIGSRINPEQVALCMAQVKIARLITSPTHQYSWIDLAGYAALGGEITERRA